MVSIPNLEMLQGWERGQDQPLERLAEDPIYRTVLVANEMWILPRKVCAKAWAPKDIVRET